MEGVDVRGRPCRVKLRLSPQMRGLAKRDGRILPDYALFADTGRRAKNPCLAGPENGPDAPLGVLLMENCRVEDMSARLFSAGWASVLRADEQDLPPALGVGYMELRQGLPDEETQAMLDEYRSLQQDADASDELLGTLCGEIYGRQKLSFAAVLLDTGKAVEVRAATDMADAAMRCMEVRTRRGAYGGVLVRVRRGTRVSALQSALVERGWRYRDKRLETIEEAWRRCRGAELTERIGTALRSCEVDCIPFTRINAGPHTNQRYGGEVAGAEVSKWERVWMEKAFWRNPLVRREDFPFWATKMALRLARTRDGADVLLSAAHAYSQPLCNALCLGRDAARAYGPASPR